MNEKALFLRKASNINELRLLDEEDGDRAPYVIEKTIELPDEEFKKFSDELLWDTKIAKENVDLMYIDDNGVWHCVLVTSREADYGVLVEAEGYDYPRYTALKQY